MGDGIVIEDSSATFTFAEVDIQSYGGFQAPIGIRVANSTGLVDVQGGTIHGMGLAAVQVEGGHLALTNVTIEDAGIGVGLNPPPDDAGTASLALNACTFVQRWDCGIEMHGVLTLSGNGNSTTNVGTLYENNATSIAGSIDFGAQGTCP